MLNSSGAILRHNVSGARTGTRIAIEDALQGRTVDDAYVNELCRYWIPSSGDKANVVLKDGQSVVVGDSVTSNGDGTFRKLISALLANTTADSTAVTNTVTETTFSNGSVTIPANSLKVGDTINFRGYAIATATNSTDTLTIKGYAGATQLFTSGALDVANNDVFEFDITLTVTAVGVSGSVTGSGTIGFGTSGTVTSKVIVIAATTIDTTAALAMPVLKATWSVASASNSTVLRHYMVRKASPTSTEEFAFATVVPDPSGTTSFAPSGANGFVPVRFM